MDIRLRKIRNGVIKDCFKDPADKDYIIARAADRIGLTDQFLWSALQAIEKYLKAILLYHDESTLNLGHDLEKSIGKVLKLNTIPLNIDADSKHLIETLSSIGRDRYFTFPRKVIGGELFTLDTAVSNIRRYCQDFEFLDLYKPRGIKYSSEEYIQEISSIDYSDLIHFRPLINSGHIEKVLDTDNFIEQRKVLIWNNINFGLRRKKWLKITKSFLFNYRKPTHFSYPEIMDWAEKRILMSKEIIQYLKTGSVKN